ncbi:MAG: hypothetical protein IJK72_03040 [Mycoplasma sp.]|nr:hypothetical protein [Mycoplasma sp.]
MKLYNVLNTSDDKTASGISWLEALEKQLGKKLPKYSSNGVEMVGGHMSSCSGRCHSWNTDYIAYIPKSFNDNQNNYEFIEVSDGCYAKYDDVKKW